MPGSSDPTADFATNLAMREAVNELNAPNTSREMPKYRCHKVVHALKIKDIITDIEIAKIEGNRETDGSALIMPEDGGFSPFKVHHDYLKKHNPHVGGYYVVYEDGYKSFSPAKAFEDGYTRI